MMPPTERNENNTLGFGGHALEMLQKVAHRRKTVLIGISISYIGFEA
jgi:hypothetical protein